MIPTFPFVDTLIAPCNPLAFIEIAMLLVKDKVAVLIVIPVVTIVGMFCIFNQFKDVIFEPLPTNALAETTPSIVTLVAWIWPLTSSAYKGLILLIPTFPLLNTLIAPINPFAFIEVAISCK